MRTPKIIFHAWFDLVTREFASLAAAKQWIADHLGADNTTDDYGVQHLDPNECTVITDVLGLDAIPRLQPPRLRDRQPIPPATQSPSTNHKPKQHEQNPTRSI